MLLCQPMPRSINVVIALSLVACGDKKQADPPAKPAETKPTETKPTETKPVSREDAFLAQMTGFRDRLCACKAGDTACADKVNADYTIWFNAAPDDLWHDPEMKKKMTPISEQFVACMTTAMTAPK